ncbi:MAG: Na(+) antiporter subunit [Devosia sp.]|nr:Na(+) antiporter subunit [Devosia sp.]
MNSLLFRTMAPVIVAAMLVFSLYLLLRGHNEPGGGFVGGLIAAAAMALLGMANGVMATRRALHFDALNYAGVGVLLAALAGVLSVFYDVPFLTGLWAEVQLFGTPISVSTPMLFDLGVYLTVFGSIVSVVLALEAGGEGA